MKADNSGNGELPIPRDLLDLLACPACESRPAVELTTDRQYLECTECHRRYPIDNGIAVMMVEAAILPDAQ